MNEKKWFLSVEGDGRGRERLGTNRGCGEGWDNELDTLVCIVDTTLCMEIEVRRLVLINKCNGSTNFVVRNVVTALLACWWLSADSSSQEDVCK